MSSYTPAQKAAYARKMARLRAAASVRRSAISGYGAYRRGATAKKRAAPKRRVPRTRTVVVQAPANAASAAPVEQPSIGSQIGGFIGHGIQKLIGSLVGFGDYEVKGNTLMDGGLSPPQIVNSVDNGGVIIRHREYLADISATIDFTLQSYAINPGLDSSFPWLSDVAAAFEEYRFRGLVYEFKSMSSDAVLSSATSSALGTVIMATSYNSANPVFPNKISMENYEFANSAKPSESFCHPIECKKSLTVAQGELFIRTGAPVTGTDIRLYDIGLFQIATQGMQAASGVAGELWCTYEVELYKPKFVTPPNLGPYIPTDHYQAIPANITNTSPMGAQTASPVASIANFLGTTVTGSSGHHDTINFPEEVEAGLFWINYSCYGVSVTVSDTDLSLVNCYMPNFWDGTGTPQGTYSTGNSHDCSTTILGFVVAVTASPATVAFVGNGFMPTTPTGADLVITQINNGYMLTEEQKKQWKTGLIRLSDAPAPKALPEKEEEDELVTVRLPKALSRKATV